MTGRQEEREAQVLTSLAPPLQQPVALGRSQLLSGSASPTHTYAHVLCLLPHPVSSVASPWVLHHPLVGFLNLFTLLGQQIVFSGCSQEEFSKRMRPLTQGAHHSQRRSSY